VIAIAVLIVVLVFSAINVLNEYERVVVFTLGRSRASRSGLVLIWPGIQRTRRVDLRSSYSTCPKQDVNHARQRSVKVNAVVIFRIVDRQGHHPGGKRLRCHQPGGQTTLRSVVGQHEMDDLLASATS